MSNCPTPTPTEIRAAREAAGLTQTVAAALVCRGLRNWQQWEAGERAMDATAWKLFTLLTSPPRP